MADRKKDIRVFERAAIQRLTAAEFLFQNDFSLDAIYLAGYAGECALKALILRRTPHGQFVSMFNELTQAGAKWSTDLRYQVGVLEFEVTRDFVEAARAICLWCARSA
jgi:hypothetical protein